MAEAEKQPIEQKKNIMGWLDKFKKIINKKTQAEKEKEFLEKVQKKYDIKSKERHEREKDAEEDYLKDSLDTIDSFRDIFAGGDLSDQEPDLVEQEEEDQLDRLKGVVEQYSDEEKKEKLEEIDDALGKLTAAVNLPNIPVSGVIQSASGIFDPVEYERQMKEANEKAIKDAAPDLVKRFRESLTKVEEPAITE